MHLTQLLLFSIATFFGFSPQKQPEKCEKKKPVEQPTCCQVQGEPLTCYGPAYNAPAAIKVCPAGATLFADASFTYWYAGEEGLRIASNGVGSDGFYYFPMHTHTLNQSFDYKPGFKVGIGALVGDEWTYRADYTWYRGKNRVQSKTVSAVALTAGTEAAATGTSVWVVDDWFLQGTTGGQALSGPQVSSAWKLSLDLIDVTVGRPFYQATRFIASPFAGLRAALIRQSMTVELTELVDLFAAIPAQPIGSRTRSNSWAIGPRVGGSGNYLMDCGFQLMGNAALSLLYTQYTSIRHSEDSASLGFNEGPYKASMNHYWALRPAAELGLGLGWGSYFSDRTYHFDVSAMYDFKIFWSQNMMRKMLDDVLTGTSPSASDLYLHGLTLTGRFDF